MSLSAGANWKIHIGPVVATPPTTSTAYAALTPWTEIGEVETIPEFGDEATEVTFLSLSAGRVRKAKGSFNSGTIDLLCGRDPLDAGQVAAKAAAGTAFQYAIRVTAADKADANDTNSIFYFTALVFTNKTGVGGADDFTKIMFRFGINSPIIEVPSTVVP